MNKSDKTAKAINKALEFDCVLVTPDMDNVRRVCDWLGVKEPEMLSVWAYCTGRINNVDYVKGYVLEDVKAVLEHYNLGENIKFIGK